MTAPEVELHLARHAFARDLPGGAVDALSAGAEILEFRAGERLFREGDPAVRAVLVLDGLVALEAHLAHRGVETTATVGADEVLGWSWLLSPHRWRFDATARTDGRAVLLDAEVVRRACAADPALDAAVHRAMAAILASRLEAARHQLLDVYRHGLA